MGFKYFAINKPYGVLSQFTDKEGRSVLSSLYSFPPNVYPVGRLDYDSEGLLLLTDDKELNNFLLNPAKKHEREYFVQVEKIPVENDLKKFEQGLIIQGIKTLSAKAEIIKDPGFPPRIPPVRERKTVPDCWLKITLYEGKNRQVRRMCAAIGFPVLRLVRVRIKNILLTGLKPGGVRELTPLEVKGLKS